MMIGDEWLLDMIVLTDNATKRKTEMITSLYEWAVEQKLLNDPEIISKLYDEARRRWGHLMTRHRISEILEGTLRKMESE